MTDSWETAQGLNPNDPNDAGRDFDYDRISNLDEFQNGTNANTDWSFVEIPEGVPLNAITSLNGLGNLAKVVAETDANGSPMGFQIWRWQRDTGWAASHSIGDHDSFILTEVKQNVFGTVAAAFKKYDSVAGRWRGEVRFVSADGGALVKIGHDQDWGIVDHLEITDSGFVIARFQDFGAGATPASKIFRWRNGFVEILKGSTANLYPKGVNERGEIIEASEGVFREGKWTSLGSSPLGINDRAEVWVTGADPNATGIGMWNLSAGYATGYYFNNLADSVAALSPEFESQLAAHASLFDKPGSSDPDDDPLDPVSFVDQENHEYFLTDPVSDAPLAYRRLLIISDINDLGDLAEVGTVDDARWTEVERYWVPLVGQVLLAPRWFNPRVAGVWIQALHDGEELALRVSWTDPSRSPDPAWEEWATKVLATLEAADSGWAQGPGPGDRLTVIGERAAIRKLTRTAGREPAWEARGEPVG